MTEKITADMVGAIKVQFINTIYGDDFPEKGMIAWLTGVDYDTDNGCYELFFDFSEFEEYNHKYFRECYFENIHTKKLNLDKKNYTAIEAGWYNPKYSAYFSVPGDGQNDDDFAEEIKKHLRVVDWM